MTFSNEQLDVVNIPSINDIEYKGLDQNYLTVELIATAIFLLIFGGSALVFIFLNLWDLPGWASSILYLLVFLIVIVFFALTIAGFKKKKYALRTHDIIYKSGIFWRTQTVLPFSRVQHAEVQQGPIERLFDLSKLKIYTAGGSSSDMIISGLLEAHAQKIKYYILHQTYKDEEE